MSARRVLLSVDEFAVACADHDISLPIGYAPTVRAGAADADVASAADAARAHLNARGISGPALAAVAHNLRLIAAARILVDTQIAGGDHGLRCLIALDDTVGATLIHSGDRGVELSVWPATALPHELRRIVPPTESALALPSVRILVDTLISALALDAHGHDDAERLLVNETGIAAADAAELIDLCAHARGSLHSTVLTATDGGVTAVAHVVWVLTDAGWLGLRRSGHGAVETAPVTADDLGAYLAPTLAELVA